MSCHLPHRMSLDIGVEMDIGVESSPRIMEINIVNKCSEMISRIIIRSVLRSDIGVKVTS